MNRIERGALLKLFIRNGYVLDFSTNDFNIFTLESVGVPICQKYELSKGKSLTAFVEEAPEKEVVKLLSDLFQYYELHCIDNYGEEKNRDLYERCRKIIDKEKSDYQLETPTVSRITNEYVIDIATRANRDIDKGEYDSAITKARTLIEEVFMHSLEIKGVEPDRSGDINKLFRQVKKNYNMHTDGTVDDRIKKLIGGLNSVVSAVAELRTIESDAHGAGRKRMGIDSHHARLFVNSSIVLCEFILSVTERNPE